MAMQEARAKMMNAREHLCNLRAFDLSGLPEYRPQGKLEGKLRFWGNNATHHRRQGRRILGQAFEAFHPKVEFSGA